MKFFVLKTDKKENKPKFAGVINNPTLAKATEVAMKVTKEEVKNIITNEGIQSFNTENNYVDILAVNKNNMDILKDGGVIPS